MNIDITPLAANKVKQALLKRGRGLGIKIGIRTTGCSGLAYTLEYVDTEPLPMEYAVIENNNIKIWADRKHQVYLDNMTIDYVRQGLNEGFEFRNPNERDRCGCGESFRV